MKIKALNALVAAALVMIASLDVTANDKPDPYFSPYIDRAITICNPRMSGIRYSVEEKETDLGYLCMDAKGYEQLYRDIYIVGWTHGVIGFMAGHYIITDKLRWEK